MAEAGPAVVGIDPATRAVDERVLGDLASLGDRGILDATVLGREVWVTSTPPAGCAPAGAVRFLRRGPG